MRYDNIDFEKDLDANSYYRITSNVKMLDDTFDKYQFSAGYGWLKLWEDKRLTTFYDNIPLPIRGKAMTSRKKQIDYFEKRGLVLSSLVAIVSERFMDVINKLGVDPSEYIVKPIEIINRESAFYMLFIPQYKRECIIAEKSLLARDCEPFDIRKIKSIEELDDPHNANLKVRSAVIGSEFNNKDFININCIPNYFISERVLDALNDNGIKGFSIEGKYELEILASGKVETTSNLSPSFFNPLSEAVIANDNELFESLISQGADKDGVDGNGLTALYYAAMYGRVDMAKRLIDLGADIEFRDRYGNTPLIQACLCYLANGADIINFLLSKGADPYAVNSHHVSPVSCSGWLSGFPETNLPK